ncbi:MAG: 50S ribosomal protein L1 [Verrucomicrobiia bacterium]|jgi:large subunit ribosomal protein L1
MPSKRYKQALEQVDTDKKYPLKEALGVLEKLPKTKFDETVEVALKLGVDPRQSDQMVRGTVPLPHGSGKNVTVIVFAKPGPSADAAIAAGAEHVGFDELIKKCVEGWTDFDVAVATPEAMVEVRKLGRVLGPRGLMPNPKTGTVTDDTGSAVQAVKAGRVEFKVDKTSNLAVVAGKRSFTADQLEENIRAIFDAIARVKPDSIKGHYVKSATVTATMSPGIAVDPKEVTVAE